MYFQNEIREIQGYGEKPKNLQIKPQEIKLAEQLIATLSEDFNPAKYRDTFQERLRALVESKQEGKPFTERRAPRQAQVIDMMDALKRVGEKRGAQANGRALPENMRWREMPSAWPANLWDPRAANVLWKMGGPSQLS